MEHHLSRLFFLISSLGPDNMVGPRAGLTIYAGGNDGKLYAFNSDSSLKWTYDTGYGTYMNAAAVTTDGSTIY